MIRASLAALLMVAAAPAPTAAQPSSTERTRTITAARQLRPGDSLRVRVSHSAGPLRIHSTPDPLLYDLALQYEPAHGTMFRRYDAASRTLTVGVDSINVGFRLRFWERVPDEAKEHPSSLTLRLGRGVPLDLGLDFGASEAVVDLSDLTVERLALRFGASETQLLFGTPNPARMRELSIACAAGSLTARQLGNANAHRVEITGVAAGLDLDLSGAWSHDMEIEADIVMGGVTLRVPDDVGVRVVTAREILGEIETPGLVARDGAHYSANWESAARKLTVSAKAILGGIAVRQIGSRK